MKKRKTKRADSIIQEDKYCLICYLFDGQYNYLDLECHHCLHGTANKAQADRLGLWIWLCPAHHRTGKDAVHRDKEIDIRIERIAQASYEKKIGDRESFMRIFGKNYL